MGFFHFRPPGALMGRIRGGGLSVAPQQLETDNNSSSIEERQTCERETQRSVASVRGKRPEDTEQDRVWTSWC